MCPHSSGSSLPCIPTALGVLLPVFLSLDEQVEVAACSNGVTGVPCAAATQIESLGGGREGEGRSTYSEAACYPRGRVQGADPDPRLLLLSTGLASCGLSSPCVGPAHKPVSMKVLSEGAGLVLIGSILNSLCPLSYAHGTLRTWLACNPYCWDLSLSILLSERQDLHSECQRLQAS